MSDPDDPFFEVLVESFYSGVVPGRHGVVHVRPVRGQGVSPELYVECPREMKDTDQFPLGSLFLLKARYSNKEGGIDFLKAPHQWGYSHITAEQAKLFLSRSRAPLTRSDLLRLGHLASEDQTDLFARKPDTGRLYVGKLFAVALCQGAALHYIDGKNGVKDLDVWNFYVEDPERPFPYRRRARVDFGDPKFGVTPDAPNFIGRRVDIIGRSIVGANPDDPIGTLRRYLHTGKTKSARLLARKAVILIAPKSLLGTVVWPAQ